MQTSMSNEPDVRSKVDETAQTLTDQAQQVATAQVASQQERLASTLDTVAQSLRDTGSSVRDQQPQIATISDVAAQRIEGFSTYLRQHDLTDLIGETESFARREPVMFLGAAFAVGFVAARFLKTSAPQSGYQSTTSYRPPQSSGTGYGSAWSSQSVSSPVGASRMGDDYSSSPLSGNSYAGAGSGYNTSGVGDYGMGGDTGMQGVGSDMEPGLPSDTGDITDFGDNAGER
jgi:ElaB/YqjD/DUF883 family membrane-anchored ribosome-binding protein